MLLIDQMDTIQRTFPIFSINAENSLIGRGGMVMSQSPSCPITEEERGTKSFFQMRDSWECWDYFLIVTIVVFFSAGVALSWGLFVFFLFQVLLIMAEY